MPFTQSSEGKKSKKEKTPEQKKAALDKKEKERKALQKIKLDKRDKKIAALEDCDGISLLIEKLKTSSPSQAKLVEYMHFFVTEDSRGKTLKEKKKIQVSRGYAKNKLQEQGIQYTKLDMETAIGLLKQLSIL